MFKKMKRIKMYKQKIIKKINKIKQNEEHFKAPKIQIYDLN